LVEEPVSHEADRQCVDKFAAGLKLAKRARELALNVVVPASPAKKNRSITKEELTLGSVSCSSALAVPVLASDGEGSSFTPSGRPTGLRQESLGLGTRKQGEAPCKPFLIEPQDVERAVIAPDLAVPVIGPEPLIEDFGDLDRALIETDSPWHGHALRFMRLDLDVHAFASIGIAH
jgi:hypothetical protein